MGFGLLLLERAQVGVLRVLRCAMTNDNRVLHKGHLIAHRRQLQLNLSHFLIPVRLAVGRAHEGGMTHMILGECDPKYAAV